MTSASLHFQLILFAISFVRKLFLNFELDCPTLCTLLFFHFFHSHKNDLSFCFFANIAQHPNVFFIFFEIPCTMPSCIQFTSKFFLE